MASFDHNPKSGRKLASNGGYKAHDGRVVAYFHDAIGWKRQPGDRLTFGQRMTIVGGIFASLCMIALGAFVLGCIMAIALETQPLGMR